MTGNPALRELGFSAEDRVVIIHADDVGMCAATIDAFFELAMDGLVRQDR
jgi:chitin disaccharide deacetylase